MLTQLRICHASRIGFRLLGFRMAMLPGIITLAKRKPDELEVLLILEILHGLNIL